MALAQEHNNKKILHTSKKWIDLFIYKKFELQLFNINYEKR